MNDVFNDPNTYDFDFENKNNEEEFDPENDPVLNAFLEVLEEAAKREQYINTPKTRIPNPKKVAEVTKAFDVLTKLIKEEHKDAIFKYELNDWLYDDNEKFEGNNVFVSGCPCMIIKSSYMSLKIQKCISSLHLVKSIDLDALTSGGVEVTIEFSNIYDTFIEKS